MIDFYSDGMSRDAGGRPVQGRGAGPKPSPIQADATSIVHAFASDVIMNADRTRMYIARDDGFLSVYDTFTGQVVQTFDVGTRLGGMDLSPDGSFLLVAEKTALSSSGTQPVAKVFAVHRVDVATGAVTDFTMTFYSIEGPFHDVALFADGTAIATTTLQGSGATITYRLDTHTGVFTTLVGNSAQAPIVTASADRLHILLTNGWNVSGPNQMYDLPAEGVIHGAASRGVAGSGESLHAFTADGSLAAYLERFIGVDIYDARLNKLTTLAGVQWNDVHGLAFDDHGDYLYVLVFSTREILKFSTSDWSVAAHIDLPADLTLWQMSASTRHGGTLVVGPDAQYLTWTNLEDLVRIENPTALTPVQGTGAGETMTGTATQDLLYGLDGDDILNGGDGNDTLRGGAGNDVLDGNVGHDAMYGGGGDDIYHADDLRDRAAEADSSGGSDEVHASVSFELEGNIERLILTGAAATDGTGNAIANIITGNEAANRLNGMGGNDLLVGGGGDDVLRGGSGADEMQGGAGNDTYFVDSLDLVADSAGFDTVFTAASYVLNAGIEIENLSAETVVFPLAINLTGNEFGQQIIGNSRANTLSGGGGADVMIGRAGHDTYIVDHGGDMVIENPGEGVDIIFTAVSYALNDGSEVEVLATIAFDATAPINLTGNGLANYMIGNDGANTLDGKGGADVMVGRAGHDTYIVDNGGDQVVEDAGGGSDIVFTAASYALNDIWEVEVLATIAFDGTAPINLTGNALANYMIGNDGANQLDGKAGSDVMVGRAGHDTYIVYDAGDQVVENAGGGSDLVFTAVSYALNDTWEVEVLATIAFDGTAPIDLTGNGLANYMIGNDGANTMDGKGGGDVLVGRAGQDRFAFTTAPGAGNVDTIFDFAAADDTIALDSELFGLADGPLDPNAFRVGTAAADADDRIIYDDTTGFLYFDADGSGTDSAAILFATLQNAPALTASEFTMI